MNLYDLVSLQAISFSTHFFKVNVLTESITHKALSTTTALNLIRSARQFNDHLSARITQRQVNYAESVYEMKSSNYIRTAFVTRAMQNGSSQTIAIRYAFDVILLAAI